MPREALPRKACGERSPREGDAASVGGFAALRTRGENFSTARPWESNGIFQVDENVWQVVFVNLREARLKKPGLSRYSPLEQGRRSVGTIPPLRRR